MVKTIKDQIRGELEAWATSTGFKILGAFIEGSRGFEVNNEFSDFDLRVIYIKPLRQYVSFQQENLKGEKSQSFDIALKPVMIKDREVKVTVQAWDILKAVDLAYKNNPSILIYSGLEDLIRTPAIEVLFETYAKFSNRPAIIRALCEQSFAFLNSINTSKKEEVERAVAKSTCQATIRMLLAKAVELNWATKNDLQIPTNYLDLLDMVYPDNHPHYRKLRDFLSDFSSENDVKLIKLSESKEIEDILTLNNDYFYEAYLPSTNERAKVKPYFDEVVSSIFENVLGINLNLDLLKKQEET